MMKRKLLCLVLLLAAFNSSQTYAGHGQSKHRHQEGEKGDYDLTVPKRIKALATHPVAAVAPMFNLEYFETTLKNGIANNHEQGKKTESILLDSTSYKFAFVENEPAFDKTLLTVSFERPVFTGDLVKRAPATRLLFEHSRSNGSGQDVKVAVKRVISGTLEHSWILTEQKSGESTFGFTLGCDKIGGELNFGLRAEYSQTHTTSAITSRTEEVHVDEEMIVPPNKTGKFTFKETRQITDVPFTAKVYIYGNVFYEVKGVGKQKNKPLTTILMKENEETLRKGGLTNLKIVAGSHITFDVEGCLKLISPPSFISEVSYEDLPKS